MTTYSLLAGEVCELLILICVVTGMEMGGYEGFALCDVRLSQNVPSLCATRAAPRIACIRTGLAAVRWRAGAMPLSCYRRGVVCDALEAFLLLFLRRRGPLCASDEPVLSPQAHAAPATLTATPCHPQPMPVVPTRLSFRVSCGRRSAARCAFYGTPS